MNQRVDKSGDTNSEVQRHHASKCFASITSIAVAVLVSACGGGGGGGSDSVSATALAQICTAGSPYAADALRKTTVGTFRDEQKWVNAYMNERYLWYKDIPGNVNPSDAAYNQYSLDLTSFNYGASLTSYYKALLNPNVTASGKKVDEFSFLVGTADWNRYFNSQEMGYGLSISGAAGGNVYISYVYPDSSGYRAGFKRGDRIVSIDGISATETDPTNQAKFNAALYPVAAGTHTFVLAKNDGKSDTITTSPVTETLKQVESKVLVNGSQKVGYLLFNSHILPAEPDLIAAANAFKGQGVNDLVIDMRYNGGGYLSIASGLAYMVAGDAATSGKTFNALNYNDKRRKENEVIPFYDTSSSGIPLPSLNLKRAYVLASADTCSASEAVVNGLRGVGVDVQLIGATTCGKPYGFVPQDNCGVTYAAMEFVGVNAKNVQVNPDGMAPNCEAGDDLTHALGDGSETMLSIALSMQRGSSCAQAQQQVSAALGSTLRRGFGTLWGGKLERPTWKSNQVIDARAR